MRAAFFLLLALACTCQAQPSPQTFKTVFKKGEAGYNSYRIPAIITTKQDTLLAFIEARKDSQGDAGNIDLLVKRSVDHGETWSPAILIWDDKNNTCGNPAPVVDHSTGTIWLLLTWNFGSDHEGAIKAGTSKHPRHVFISSSTDDGNHWATPTRISSSARKDHWRWYATGPGNGIQLTRGPLKGRLVIPCNHSDHSDKSLHPYRVTLFIQTTMASIGKLEQSKPRKQTNLRSLNYLTVVFSNPCVPITANTTAPWPSAMTVAIHSAKSTWTMRCKLPFAKAAFFAIPFRKMEMAFSCTVTQQAKGAIISQSP